METKQTFKQFIEQSMNECRFDVDVEFCKEHEIKYDNHEVDASEVDLFNREANIRAFDFVFKNR